MEKTKKISIKSMASKCDTFAMKMMSVASDEKFMNRVMTVFMVLMFASAILSAIAIPGFANSDKAIKDIEEIAEKVYGFILGISTVLAVVAESVAACMYFFSSDGKKVEQASSWMKRIALGWVFINGMGILVNMFTGFVGKNYNWK